jgi:hypothetical protein
VGTWRNRWGLETLRPVYPARCGCGPHTIPIENILLKKLIYSLEEIKLSFIYFFINFLG